MTSVAYHGTNSLSAVAIAQEGFTLDTFRAGTQGKGIYLSKNKEKCKEYGRHLLKVTYNDDEILKTSFKAISEYVSENGGFMFGFEKYTRSLGFKGLEMIEFDGEIVIYDLSCINNISRYS